MTGRAKSPCIVYESSVSHMNESFHIWVPNEYEIVYHVDKSYHSGRSCVPYENVMFCVPYENVMFCVPYENVMYCVPYENVMFCVPYENVMYCVPYENVMFSMNKSCRI